jgi:hypothetical protein
MSKMILLIVSLILAFMTFSFPAFSQAIAESVLLGAGSSTATVTAGSALNSGLNQSGKQLAGRVQQQVSRHSKQRRRRPDETYFRRVKLAELSVVRHLNRVS